MGDFLDLFDSEIGSEDEDEAQDEGPRAPKRKRDDTFDAFAQGIDAIPAVMWIDPLSSMNPPEFPPHSPPSEDDAEPEADDSSDEERPAAAFPVEEFVAAFMSAGGTEASVAAIRAAIARLNPPPPQRHAHQSASCWGCDYDIDSDLVPASTVQEFREIYRSNSLKMSPEDLARVLEEFWRQRVRKEMKASGLRPPKWSYESILKHITEDMHETPVQVAMVERTLWGLLMVIRECFMVADPTDSTKLLPCVKLIGPFKQILGEWMKVKRLKIDDMWGNDSGVNINSAAQLIRNPTSKIRVDN